MNIVYNQNKNLKSSCYSNQNFSSFNYGDAIVHIHHGVGRYRGLILMNLIEGEVEFLHIEYFGKAMLYVPIRELHLILPYNSINKDNAPLHTLGSRQWERSKNQVIQQVKDISEELLNLYAKRKLQIGYSFKFNLEDYKKFSKGFIFKETIDQSNAISDVICDMMSKKPMDRLICGDVGFGKTEIALRSAFIAVMNNKQVAFLSPTTLLSEQHVKTFINRFSNFSIKIIELSRLKSLKKFNIAIKEINDGTSDIVIGTHKLFSKKIKFNRLGLLIIDEEHRFGVEQKEAFKKLYPNVDILSLTATPIPRSLGMALNGIKDFSIITSPPQNRIATKTFICEENNNIIYKAINNELNRNGQVYFIHNEIKTIEKRKNTLLLMFPSANISVIHGNMNENSLEKIMKNFIEQKINILISTIIIEIGIDVPSANTIIIYRSDKFGLAQLHQLRGRVGRSCNQSYAYLLTPSKENLTERAICRFNAIKEMDKLGSGLSLSMHDLEIRGAGEILGKEQAGKIQEIGFQLYSKMLINAINFLKNGNTIKNDKYFFPISATINLHTSSILPNSYCRDIQDRIYFYRMLANCKSNNNINYIKKKLIKQFGELPMQASILIETHKIRIIADSLAILKIDIDDKVIKIQFHSYAPVNIDQTIKNIIYQYKDVKFLKENILYIKVYSQNINDRIENVKQVLEKVKLT